VSSELPAAGGVIPVDKPAGPTSHDIVAIARRSLGTRRVGHTGTLDPFATGLLLLCVGPATRLVEFLTGLPKTYQARVRLGVTTTTDDPEGEVVASSESWRDLQAADVERALAPLRGPILQTPPRFSAKKIAGEAAHYRARRGEDVELAPAEVEVFRLDLVGWDPPHLDLEVLCSSGTYVRALARDLGEALGTGAHLETLRRTAVGNFGVEAALRVEQLADPAAVAGAWVTPAAALAHLPRVEVGVDQVARLAHGEAVAMEPSSEVAADGPVAVVSDRELVAVASREGDRLRPRKVFVGVAP
jgi:tRNA pseudouridine55 synthase